MINQTTMYGWTWVMEGDGVSKWSMIEDDRGRHVSKTEYS
jgi:hypothetical protein